MVGADSTWPSRTIANCFSVPYRAREMVVKTSVPEPSKSRDTIHSTCCCGMPASAEDSWVPSIMATDRRYFTPSASQVTSGLSGSSSTSAVSPWGGHW